MLSQITLANGRVAFQGSAEEFLESDGYKAIAGGDEKDGLDDLPQTPGEVKKPFPVRKPSLASTPSAASFKPRSFAQVAAHAANKTLPPSSSTEVTSASEGGDDDESDSDPTIDGDEPKMNGKLLSTPAKAPAAEKKPRKLVEEESRAVGRVSGAVWKLYLGMMGGVLFWFCFAVIFAGAKLSDVAQTWWLGVWAGACEFSPLFSRSMVLRDFALTFRSRSGQPRASAQHQLLPRALRGALGHCSRHRDAAVVRALQRHAARLEQAARALAARRPPRAAPLVRQPGPRSDREPVQQGESGRFLLERFLLVRS